MQNFIQFNPILRQSPEDILAYYQENNIELPDNKYLLDYLSPAIPLEIQSKFEVGKKGSFTKKELPEIKKIELPKKE